MVITQHSQVVGRVVEILIKDGTTFVRLANHQESWNIDYVRRATKDEIHRPPASSEPLPLPTDEDFNYQGGRVLEDGKKAVPPRGARVGPQGIKVGDYVTDNTGRTAQVDEIRSVKNGTEIRHEVLLNGHRRVNFHNVKPATREEIASAERQHGVDVFWKDPLDVQHAKDAASAIAEGATATLSRSARWFGSFF
jgi:hypothetical protein